MIKVKHFMEGVEADDGLRIWVEPLGLTQDLSALCAVDRVLPALGPPQGLWQWFENHPQGYEFFRGRYHEYLAVSRLKPFLQQRAKAAVRANFTLLHQGNDPDHNTAAALHEFLSELSAYCPPDP